MSNLKLNKKVEEKDFEVIPDIPDISDLEIQDNDEDDNNEEVFVKKEEKEKRKLFANKKANIALGIVGGIIAVSILGAIILVTFF